MQLTPQNAAVILGIVILQIFSISQSSPPPDCLASVDTCMSNLCKSEQAFFGDICGDDGCQIKATEVCNMTIQAALDQFPSLQGCVCTWEEEICGSIQALATQCRQMPAVQQKRSTMMDWQSSSLIGYEYTAGSCLDQVKICVRDAVCNRYLATVAQACMAEQCDHDRCQQATQQFYGSTPHNVAEMLVLCECDGSDQNCVHTKTALHSGTCGDETWICQDTVSLCVEDSDCRDLLKRFRTTCWSSEEAQCSDSDLQNDECFTQMDPAFILGADSECKVAFLATLGTTLHYPCTCKGVHDDDLWTCNMIHDVFHNRSHYMTSWKSSSASSKTPPNEESKQGHTWSHDYLLYTFAPVLLVGVAILIPLAVVVGKIWIMRRRDKAKFHHPQKSNCVVIL